MGTTAASELARQAEVRALRARGAELAANDHLRRVLERNLGRHWLPKSIREPVLPETAMPESQFLLSEGMLWSARWAKAVGQ